MDLTGVGSAQREAKHSEVSLGVTSKQSLNLISQRLYTKSPICTAWENIASPWLFLCWWCSPSHWNKCCCYTNRIVALGCNNTIILPERPRRQTRMWDHVSFLLMEFRNTRNRWVKTQVILMQGKRKGLFMRITIELWEGAGLIQIIMGG